MHQQQMQDSSTDTRTNQGTDIRRHDLRSNVNANNVTNALTNFGTYCGSSLL